MAAQVVLNRILQLFRLNNPSALKNNFMKKTIALILPFLSFLIIASCKTPPKGGGTGGSQQDTTVVSYSAKGGPVRGGGTGGSQQDTTVVHPKNRLDSLRHMNIKKQ